MIFPLLGKPKVIVHLVDAPQSIEGVLYHKGLRELHLISATIWETTEASRPLDGTVVIPRERVFCWQVVR